jgi:hypothetical protein
MNGSYLLNQEPLNNYTFFTIPGAIAESDDLPQTLRTSDHFP